MILPASRFGSDAFDTECLALRARITERCAAAQVLLIRANNDDVKGHVRFAVEELTAATRLLNNPASATSPELFLQVVEAAIASATLRLQLVETALSVYGPEASDI